MCASSAPFVCVFCRNSRTFKHGLNSNTAMFTTAGEYGHGDGTGHARMGYTYTVVDDILESDVRPGLCPFMAKGFHRPLAFLILFYIL